jgi:hypothetical protein
MGDMSTRPLAAVLAGVLALAFATSATASDDSIRRRGECAGGPSDWKLVVRQETASTLRVKFEIEGGAEGQTWQLFISDDGDRIFAGNRTSQQDGYVRVVREPTDRAGSDRIEAMGVNLATGESCGGSLTY